MTTLTLKIENDLKKKAHAFADQIGVSLSSLIKMLLRDTIRHERLDISTQPRYHGEPEEGDLNFKNLEESIKYIEKTVNEKRCNMA